MRIIFLIIAIALINISAMAHNPLTAKFELNATAPEGAFLSINLSQTGLHQTLIKHFSDTDFTVISENDYKKLAVNYLKKHINIQADETFLEIGEGGIKLGNHQTDFKFLIKNYPREVGSLYVEVNAFKENENHHSAFWWKNRVGKSKVILSAKNNFQGNFNGKQNNSTMFLSFGESNLSIFLGIFLLFIFYGIYRKTRLISTAGTTSKKR